MNEKPYLLGHNKFRFCLRSFFCHKYFVFVSSLSVWEDDSWTSKAYRSVLRTHSYLRRKNTKLMSANWSIMIYSCVSILHCQCSLVIFRRLDYLIIFTHSYSSCRWNVFLIIWLPLSNFFIFWCFVEWIVKGKFDLRIVFNTQELIKYNMSQV